ncbi:MAG: hypothetical protein WAL80_17295 [Xanthobacteraceae bacterium]|jgi:hypothetical protein
MNANQGLTWPQIRYWLICGALLIGGGAATIWGDKTWPFVKELGPGIFTAGILAALVEPFFRHEFARDAFLAAFRYVMPDELKEEVQRIIGYKFLSTDSRMIVKIEPIPTTDLVRVHLSLERTVKNVSRHTEITSVMFALDEWGFDGQQSKIDECSFDIGNGPEHCGDERHDDPVVGKRRDNISIQSGQTYKVVMKGSEIHRDNDALRMFHNHAAINPVVELHAPADFKYGCSFGVPGEKISPSRIDAHYRLDGTQFPGQCTYIRWWREKSEASK